MIIIIILSIFIILLIYDAYVCVHICQVYINVCEINAFIFILLSCDYYLYILIHRDIIEKRKKEGGKKKENKWNRKYNLLDVIVSACYTSLRLL